MIPKQTDELGEILKALQTGGHGVRAAFLATVQGDFLASTELSGMERVQLGGISAASLAIGTKGVKDLQLGELGQIHIVGSAGTILLLKVGTKAVLTLVVEEGVELAPVLQDAEKTAPRLDAAI